jgi:hypothetical protein
MKFGSSFRKFITKEEVYGKNIKVVILSYEERSVLSLDKSKTYQQTLVETDKGWLNGWDCYPCDIEIGNKVVLTCADLKDKITITKLL